MANPASFSFDMREFDNKILKFMLFPDWIYRKYELAITDKMKNKTFTCPIHYNEKDAVMYFLKLTHGMSDEPTQ
jgi:hypothetical protein